MERLAEKRDGQNVIPLRQDGKIKWSLCSAGMEDASTQFLYGDYADKLAEYEDTGLMPEQIVEIDKLYTEKCRELYEYRRLEEQGKLLKLPCAVGDTVYQINKVKKEPIIPMRVIGIAIRDDGKLVIQTKDIADGGHNLYSSNNMGKTVFLTKEKAEASLKGL